MTDVMTVTGPVPAGSLGPTLMHEHVLIDHMADNWMAANLLNDPDLAERELLAAREAGVTTVVDQTGRGASRDPEVLREISERAGVNIITGTGWIKERLYPRDFAKRGADSLAATMAVDVTFDIGYSGVRAGILGEINVHGRWVTPGEERMHRAAARAHLATGAPLAIGGTHVSTAMDQLEILEEERVDLRGVIVNHVNGTADFGLWKEIAERGPFTCFDSFPVASPRMVDRDVKLIIAMMRGGLGDHVLVSTGVSTRRQLAAYGGEGYGFAVDGLRRRALAAGMSKEEWNQATVINPARALSGER